MADGSRDSYWAAGTAQEIAEAVPALKSQWYTALERRGVLQLQRLIYAHAFGMNSAGGRSGATQMLQFCGPQAAFIRFRVNRARTLIKQRVITAAGDRPSFGVQSMNSDVRSSTQISIARGIIDYTFRAAKGEQACLEALTGAGFFAEAFLHGMWDFDAGDLVPVEEPVMEPVLGPDGQPMQGLDGKPQMQPETWPDGTPVTKTVRKKSGLPRVKRRYSWEVTKPVHDDGGDLPWAIVHEPRNKYELALNFPELADRIKALSTASTSGGPHQRFIYDAQLATDDVVFVDHIYHRNCAAVPGGKYVCLVGDIVLWDLPCPLDSGIPVISICPGKYFGTNIGYPEAADLMAIEEMRDELLSIAANNYVKFGKQNLFGPKGLELDLAALAQGGRYFGLPEGEGQMPKAVQWASLPESFHQTVQLLSQYQNDVIGANPVSLGTPEREYSGKAMQLMLSVAKKFAAADEAAYDFALTETGNMLLELIRKNCDTQFLAEVVGDNNLPYLAYFTKDDLAGVKRVIVNRQNPVLNNPVGRLELAEQLKDINKQDRYGYVQLITEGNIDPLIEQDQSCLNLIKFENSQLARGIYVEPKESDDPMVHGRRHQAMYDKLRTTENPDPQILGLFEQHIAGHATQWAKINPVVAQMLDLPRPPSPPPKPGGMPEPQPQGAGPKGPPEPKPMPEPKGMPLPNGGGPAPQPGPPQ